MWHFDKLSGRNVIMWHFDKLSGRNVIMRQFENEPLEWFLPPPEAVAFNAITFGKCRGDFFVTPTLLTFGSYGFGCLV